MLDAIKNADIKKMKFYEVRGWRLPGQKRKKEAVSDEDMLREMWDEEERVEGFPADMREHPVQGLDYDARYDEEMLHELHGDYDV